MLLTTETEAGSRYYDCPQCQSFALVPRNPGTVCTDAIPAPSPLKVLYQQAVASLIDFADTDAWLAERHPAVWSRIRAIDDELLRLEHEQVDEAVFQSKLDELLAVCRQGKSLRDGSWPAMLVKSSVLGGEEVWVCKRWKKSRRYRTRGTLFTSSMKY